MRMTRIDVTSYCFINDQVEPIVESPLDEFTVQNRTGRDAKRSIDRVTEKVVLRSACLPKFLPVGERTVRTLIIIFFVAFLRIVVWFMQHILVFPEHKLWKPFLPSSTRETATNHILSLIFYYRSPTFFYRQPLYTYSYQF